SARADESDKRRCGPRGAENRRSYFVNVGALAERILAFSSAPTRESLPPDAIDAVNALLDALERGEVRAAERASDGQWNAVPWVKKGILLGFKLGDLREYAGTLPFVDKHTFPV